MAYKLFIDTNVYLDLLMQRGTDWLQVKSIFELAERNELEIYTSASSVLNIMYVLKNYKFERKVIVDNACAILSFAKLVNPGNITFEIALLSAFRDLEDAVQYYTALEIKGINYFITSNTKDYRNELPILKVLSPEEFMKKYGEQP